MNTVRLKVEVLVCCNEILQTFIFIKQTNCKVGAL